MTSTINPDALASDAPSLTALRQQLAAARDEVTALQAAAARAVVALGQHHQPAGKTDADTDAATLHTLTLPAGTLGPADTLRVSGLVSTTGGGLLTTTLSVGGVVVWSCAAALPGLAFDVWLSGRGAGGQIVSVTAPRALAAPRVTAIDVGQPQTVALRVQWDAAGDGSGLATLESFLAERIPGV